MGLFGGSSKSRSNQTTQTTAVNSQGNVAPTLSSTASNISYAEQGGLSANRSNLGYAEAGGFSVGRGVLTVNNANSTELAEQMSKVSVSALGFYDEQNKRSLDLAKDIAIATTQSNSDVISEFAKLTEEQSKSEALMLNDSLLKYSALAVAGGLIYMGLK
jgi:hypothetical protein